MSDTAPDATFALPASVAPTSEIPSPVSSFPAEFKTPSRLDTRRRSEEMASPLLALFTEAYRSIHVDVHSARDLPTRAGKPVTAYIVLGVDSKEYKTQACNGTAPTWSEHFEFDVLSTTRGVRLAVYEKRTLREDRPIGYVFIPIQDVLEKRIEGKTEEDMTLSAWYDLHSTASLSTSPSSPSSAAGTSPAPDTPTDGTSARPAVRVTVSMSDAEVKDHGHKALAESLTNALADTFRHAVSKKKRRWQFDGFDLDLTYVTDRIIAMGFPSQKLEGVYRNHLNVIRKFFTKRHPDAYKIYNLCLEREYPSSTFEGPVARFGFYDHNACPFGMIGQFCLDAYEWLNGYPQRVAAIHCKAGKGRTGLFISCFLVYSGMFPDALSALKYYGNARTKNGRGVTIPSQIRYTHYWDRYLNWVRPVVTLPEPPADRVRPPGDAKNGETAKPKKKKVFTGQELEIAESRLRLEPLPTYPEWVRLRSIRVEPLPIANSLSPATEVFFTIVNHRPDNTELTFNSKGNIPMQRVGDSNYILFDCWDERKSSPLPWLCGDVRLIFSVYNKLGKKTKLFQCWFNTQFLEREYASPAAAELNSKVPLSAPGTTNTHLITAPFFPQLSPGAAPATSDSQPASSAFKSCLVAPTLGLAGFLTPPTEDQCERIGQAAMTVPKLAIDAAVKDFKGNHKKFPAELTISMAFDVFLERKYAEMAAAHRTAAPHAPGDPAAQAVHDDA